MRTWPPDILAATDARLDVQMIAQSTHSTFATLSMSREVLVLQNAISAYKEKIAAQLKYGRPY